MKIIAFHQRSVVIAVLILIGTTGQVSAQYSGGAGTTWNNPLSASASGILASRLGHRDYSGLTTGSDHPQLTIEQMNRAVRYRSTGTPLALETVVNSFGNDTGQKTQVRTLLTQFLATYNEEASKHGYPNDLAFAVSSFIAMNCTVYHETELPSGDRILELRNAIAGIAAQEEIFNGLDDRQKQTAAETLVLVSGLAYLGYIDARGRTSPSEVKVFQQLAGESLKKVFGLEPDKISFTKDGFAMTTGASNVSAQNQTGVARGKQINSLIGTWSDVSSGGFAVIAPSGSVSTGRGGNALAYVFKADGSYIYQASFDGVVGGITVFIYETGTYSVSGKTLVLNSRRKLYRRNGVDDWSNASETRSFQFSFERDELVLKINTSLTRLSRKP